MTVDNSWFAQAYAGAPLMAILRGLGVERSLELTRRAWELGISSVEVPVQAEADYETLAALVEAGRDQNALIGAGTVLTREQVDRSLEVGAAYLVAPGLDVDLVRYADSRGLPTLPGVATPSEVQAAVALGLTWLKAFPAAWLGTSWFKLLRGPFPQVHFVATGGMDASNAGDFLAAGVEVVAVGSALEDDSQLPRLAALLTD